MKKLDYFLAALHAGVHRRRAWVISAFSITREAPDAWRKAPYQYRLVWTPTNVSFVQMGADGVPVLEAIEDATPGQALYTFLEAIVLKAGEFINVAAETRTTLGNVLFNACSIVPAFGKKIPFITGPVDVSSIEGQIAPLLEDNVAQGQPEDPAKIYVHEYLVFANSFNYLTEFTQLCVQGLTKAIILPPPGLKEYKAKLIEENKAELQSGNNAAAVAKIDAALIKFDAEYYKNDPGSKFLISKKSRETVRKKVFLTYGAEGGLSNRLEVDFVQNSLYEGWQTEKLPTMINVLRAGSFDRGSETQLGGESVKWLLRASSNIRVIDGDCGTKLGMPYEVNASNVGMLVGHSVITTSGFKLVETKDQAGEYMGKKLMMRSPQYCGMRHTDFCTVCMGTNLSRNKDGVSMAITAYGSGFMMASLAAFHSKALVLARMDLETAWQ